MESVKYVAVFCDLASEPNSSIGDAVLDLIQRYGLEPSDYDKIIIAQVTDFKVKIKKYPFTVALNN